MIQFNFVCSKKGQSALNQLPIGQTDIVIDYNSLFTKLSNNDIMKFPPTAITMNFYMYLTLANIFVCNKTAVIYYLIKESSEKRVDDIAKDIERIAKFHRRDIAFKLLSTLD